MIPFIDLKAQQDRIRPQIEAAIRRVLDHGEYIMGAEILELEEKLATFVGSKHCLTCSSGTDALLMGLMAYDVKPGDAIFTTPFTFTATAEVISLLGATPVFVDIERDTYNVDPARIEATINRIISEGKLNPRGIIPVDLFGLPADYDAIMPIAEKYGLFVLQDAAQSFGAQYRGKKCPSLGHIGVTSFFPAKPLGCYGDGGAVFTDDAELAEIMQSIRVHGKGEDKYNNIRVGLNARMDTLQAAILLEKFKIFPEEIELRQEVARKYRDHVATIVPSLKFQRIPQDLISVYAQFCVESVYRNDIQAALKQAGIPTAIYYPKPLHLLTAFSYLGYDEGDMLVTEEVAKNIFALPMHPYLTEQDIVKIIKTISEIPCIR
jgi:UDP-2-acetamido-2-deoxy-ribo-hexuluronate aminotransferase